MEEIKEFIGEYAFMDNDFMAYLKIGDNTYLCVESAYQADRMADKEMQHMFVNLSGKEARAIGMFIKEQDNWDELKMDKLLLLTMEKYKQNPELANKLLETKNIPITHPFLGETLTIVRERLGSIKHEVNYGVI